MWNCGRRAFIASIKKVQGSEGGLVGLDERRFGLANADNVIGLLSGPAALLRTDLKEEIDERII